MPSSKTPLPSCVRVALTSMAHAEPDALPFGTSRSTTSRSASGPRVRQDLLVSPARSTLRSDAVKRLVRALTVEAGERRVSCPAISRKGDPYLRPLYDALYDLLGFDKTGAFERSTIEIAPLAYMRGARPITRSSS